jgi:hypothetical protein
LSGSTLPYRESTELAECIRIMGEANAESCREQVLGEPKAPATHHQLPGITSPVPIDVWLNPDGTASLRVKQISVIFEPDVRSTDPTKANTAETTFRLQNQPINWLKGARSGLITSFTGPGPVEVRIRTTYGPGAMATGQSGYGRGTTPADIRSATTTLGFHEGRHGMDFLEFMAANPFPRFTGRVGMSEKAFKAATDSFLADKQRYKEEMWDFSQQRTDCVGSRTIDEANAEKGIQSSICKQVPSLP